MADLPRLNGIIKALEEGKTAFTTFTPPGNENAVTLAASDYDGVVYELEHNPYDITQLRSDLQFMLNRKQIADAGSVAPKVTPIVRIPPNGGEMSQIFAKQVLDVGAYGVVWPHVSTVDEAYNAVAACRYPRPPESDYFEPFGQRGDAPANAARYWGIGQQEYYKKADVWPLNPEGEIICIIMCEEVKAIENLDDILKQVPGIGIILIGEGDLSQELGHPRDYYHPVVAEAMAEIRKVCDANDVVVGHPHGTTDNMELTVEQGYRFIMTASTRSYAGLQSGKKLTNRE
ncbi:MAG: aldolase/citrate lyase family protein [Dehalococcoidia bacterium]